MKRKLLQLITTSLIIGSLASCTKEQVSENNSQIASAPQTTSSIRIPVNNIVAPKLQKITTANNPYASFTYDASGRLTKAATYQGYNTYTYGPGTLIFKKFFTNLATPVQELSGKLNASGYVTSFEGYIAYPGSPKLGVKFWYTYDAGGRLTTFQSQVTEENGKVNTGKIKYVWQNGNIVKSEYYFNNVIHSTTGYTYTNLADKTGIWQETFNDYADKFLGVRNKNLIANTTTWPKSGPISTHTQTWKVNAAGYPVSSTLAGSMTGSFGTITFNYFFQ